jgi:hypothetical protein
MGRGNGRHAIGGGAIIEQHAAAAIDLCIDKAGQQITTGKIDNRVNRAFPGLSDGGNPAILNRQPGRIAPFTRDKGLTVQDINSGHRVRVTLAR